MRLWFFVLALLLWSCEGVLNNPDCWIDDDEIEINFPDMSFPQQQFKWSSTRAN